MFITSVSYKGNLGGLLGADQKCQMLADGATPKVEGTFIAWLSDATDSPSTRLDTSFTGAYKLVNGVVIASNGWADLTDGMLKNPINVNENKDLTDENVWTNTAADGTAVDVEKHCANWSSSVSDAANKVTYGINTATDTAWTQVDIESCSFNLRIYRFENP